MRPIIRSPTHTRSSPAHLCRAAPRRGRGDRHEPPVSAERVSVLHDAGDLVVVNKPASLPIHPGGRYRRNTLVAVLAKEHGLPDLHPVHRLDRLTSGVLLLARSARAADRVRVEFERGAVRKLYLARVAGRFPAAGMTVDQPLRCKNHREAIHEVHPEVRFAACRLHLHVGD
jgi:23S rRNA-/tRNA-specific pseudouridylate synthase